VSVAVVETTDAGTRVSNAIEGFQIDALPTSALPAGTVTLAFLESLVEMARQNLAAVEATALDSVDFKIALASQITQLEWLTGEINRVVQDPNQAFELGSLNQQVIEVAPGDLQHVDRLILGMLTEMASGETALAALMSDEYATSDRVVRAARSSSACQAAGAGQVLDTVGQGDQDAVQQSFTVLNDAAFGCGVIESVTPVIQVVGGLAGVGLGAAALLGVSSSALTVPVALVGIITFQTGAALWGVGHLLGQDTADGAVLVQEGQTQIIHLVGAGVAKLAGTGLVNLVVPGLGERLVGAYGLIEGSKVLLSLLGVAPFSSPPPGPSPGITVKPTSGLVTTEAGGEAEFYIVLNTKPSDVVTINVDSNKPAEGTVSPVAAVFNPTNWFFPQRFVVTGADDEDEDGDMPYTIVTHPAASNDANNGRDAANVAVTNRDDDKVYRLSIDDVTVTEGAAAVFLVTLSEVNSAPVTFQYSTADGSATAGADYTAAPLASKTIAAGALGTTISVPTIDDSDDEPPQTFFVNVSNPAGAVILDGQGAATIRDNDPPGLTIADVEIREGDSPDVTEAIFLIDFAAPLDAAVTIQYRTNNGTASANADYQSVPLTTMTIRAGSIGASVHVNVLGDDRDERDETFLVTIVSATGATIVDGQATGVIKDDDAPPAFSGNVSGAKTATEPTFGCEFRHSIAGTVTINLAGSGTAADPYTGTMEADGTDTVSTVSPPPGLDCSADNVFFGSVAPTPITANGNTIEATLAGDGFTVRFRGQVQSDRITGTTTVTIPDFGLVIDIGTTLTQTATLAMLMSRSQRSPTPAIPSWAAVDAVLASWDSRWSGH
jgi:hypothetical protein